MRYSCVEEAELLAEHVAVVPEDVDRERVRFQQASEHRSRSLSALRPFGFSGALQLELGAGSPACLPACLPTCRGTRAPCRSSWARWMRCWQPICCAACPTRCAS